MPHTIYIQVTIESPENASDDRMTPGELEIAIKRAILASPISQKLDIDSISADVDCDYGKQCPECHGINGHASPFCPALDLSIALEEEEVAA